MAEKIRDEAEAPRPPDQTKTGDHLDKQREREKLIRDPNLNQAGNWRGSLDQTQGSQTGSDVDVIPKP